MKDENTKKEQRHQKKMEKQKEKIDAKEAEKKKPLIEDVTTTHKLAEKIV